MKLSLISLLVLLFNIPFGYWRANVRKYSLQWVLAIHLPVPIIVLTRFFFNLGFGWETYLFFVGAFFIGQQSGSIIHRRFQETKHKVTSCLVIDLKRIYLSKYLRS